MKLDLVDGWWLMICMMVVDVVVFVVVVLIVDFVNVMGMCLLRWLYIDFDVDG